MKIFTNLIIFKTQEYYNKKENENKRFYDFVILVVGKRKKYSIAFIAMHVEKVFAKKNSVELVGYGMNTKERTF